MISQNVYKIFTVSVLILVAFYCKVFPAEENGTQVGEASVQLSLLVRNEVTLEGVLWSLSPVGLKRTTSGRVKTYHPAGLGLA